MQHEASATENVEMSSTGCFSLNAHSKFNSAMLVYLGFRCWFQSTVSSRKPVALEIKPFLNRPLES